MSKTRFYVPVRLNIPNKPLFSQNGWSAKLNLVKVIVASLTETNREQAHTRTHSP